MQALVRGPDAAQQRLGLGMLAHVRQRGCQVGLVRQRDAVLLLVRERGRQIFTVQRRRLNVLALPIQHKGEGGRRGAGGRVGAPIHPAADREHDPPQRLRLGVLARLNERLAQVAPRGPGRSSSPGAHRSVRHACSRARPSRIPPV